MNSFFFLCKALLWHNQVYFEHTPEKRRHFSSHARQHFSTWLILKKVKNKIREFFSLLSAREDNFTYLNIFMLSNFFTANPSNKLHSFFTVISRKIHWFMILIALQSSIWNAEYWNFIPSAKSKWKTLTSKDLRANAEDGKLSSYENWNSFAYINMFISLIHLAINSNARSSHKELFLTKNKKKLFSNFLFQWFYFSRSPSRF